GRNVFVSQRRGSARFAQETFTRLVAWLGTGKPDDFQCNLALKRGIGGAIGNAHGAVPKFVKTSILTTIDLVNAERFRALGHSFFAGDPNAQQANHAAQSAARCFFEHAAAGRTRRSFWSSRLHLAG